MGNFYEKGYDYTISRCIRAIFSGFLHPNVMNAKVNQSGKLFVGQKEKKDTGQKHYQEVLERYAKYDAALKMGIKQASLRN